VRVPKKLAIFGFNLCASIFIGLCVYGLMIYSKDNPPPGSLLSSVLYALAAIGCIVGICYFGRQWDMRNAEEARTANETASLAETAKKGKSSKKT
jgi:hypothetical protein